MIARPDVEITIRIQQPHRAGSAPPAPQGKDVLMTSAHSDNDGRRPPQFPSRLLRVSAWGSGLLAARSAAEARPPGGEVDDPVFLTGGPSSSRRSTRSPTRRPRSGASSSRSPRRRPASRSANTCRGSPRAPIGWPSCGRSRTGMRTTSTRRTSSSPGIPSRAPSSTRSPRGTTIPTTPRHSRRSGPGPTGCRRG